MARVDEAAEMQASAISQHQEVRQSVTKLEQISAACLNLVPTFKNATVVGSRTILQRILIVQPKVSDAGSVTIWDTLLRAAEPKISTAPLEDLPSRRRKRGTIKSIKSSKNNR